MHLAPGRTASQPHSLTASQLLHNAFKLKCKETPEVLPSRKTILLCPCLLVFLARSSIMLGCVQVYADLKVFVHVCMVLLVQ